jgi:quinol-cytochrome oxidoreductase complex cytochrome b subunit
MALGPRDEGLFDLAMWIIVISLMVLAVSGMIWAAINGHWWALFILPALALVWALWYVFWPREEDYRGH